MEENANEKRIETLELAVKDIGTGFGNPRKIKKKELEKLEQSIDMFGDFGIFLIDEQNNVIAGNQRLSILKKRDPDIKVLCKKLIGYSEAELRAINIKDNTHSGEWDLEMLADWTADLNVDLGIQEDEDPNDRVVHPDMDLIRYEKYDYVMIVCRSELDYNELVRTLGIEGKKVRVHEKRKIKARAIWYDQMKCQLVEKVEK